jgi:non-ribosomal peptide synthetase component F
MDKFNFQETDIGKVHVNGSVSVFSTVNNWLDYGFGRHETSPALTFGTKEYTYLELNKLSEKIASYLQSAGVNKGDRIGICLERSPEMIACLIGILKAGAAYVPLDPNYPPDRL